MFQVEQDLYAPRLRFPSTPPNDVSVNVRVNVRVKNSIIDIIGQFPAITVKGMAKILSVSERTVYREINKLKNKGKLERIGSDKTGYWRIR
ncbi:MAG: HTH domain-containing protein [Bacteroidales bacterium]|nr:HTH domain-containing protein [Bacteroidales bacterium]